MRPYSRYTPERKKHCFIRMESAGIMDTACEERSKWLTVIRFLRLTPMFRKEGAIIRDGDRQTASSPFLGSRGRAK